MTSNACFEGIPARLLGTHKVDSGDGQRIHIEGGLGQTIQIHEGCSGQRFTRNPNLLGHHPVTSNGTFFTHRVIMSCEGGRRILKHKQLRFDINEFFSLTSVASG